MEPERGSHFRVFFFILGLSVLAGFTFNYVRGNGQSGFVSPVVFGAGEGPKTNNLSPFALLFQKGKVTVAQMAPTLLGNVLGLSVKETTTNPSVSNNPSSSRGPEPAPTTTTASSSNSNSSSGSSLSPGSSSSSSSDSTPTAGAALTSSQQAVSDASSLVISYLTAQNYAALYNLMSLDFKNTFGQNDFVASFSGAATVTGGTTSSTPNIYGDSSQWAEQNITLTLSDNSSQKYLNIYHLENSAWTLFATEEQ